MSNLAKNFWNYPILMGTAYFITLSMHRMGNTLRLAQIKTRPYGTSKQASYSIHSKVIRILFPLVECTLRLPQIATICLFPIPQAAFYGMFKRVLKLEH